MNKPTMIPDINEYMDCNSIDIVNVVVVEKDETTTTLMDSSTGNFFTATKDQLQSMLVTKLNKHDMKSQ